MTIAVLSGGSVERNYKRSSSKIIVALAMLFSDNKNNLEYKFLYDKIYLTLNKSIALIHQNFPRI